MITEDYVSFETAKLLKEKGFNESTICRYAGEGGITEKWYDDYRERVLRFDWEEGYLIEPPMEPKDQYEIIGNTISTPTLQTAMKWLRKVHNTLICIIPSEVGVGVMDYTYVLYKIDTKNFYFEDLGIQGRAKNINEISYEQACEAAIKYCLENLI